MKSRPSLLVRDALAHAFQSALAGDAGQAAALDALAVWAGGAAPSDAIHDLRAEDGSRLFEAGRMADRFAELEAWTRDRAQRIAAARSWIEADGSAGDPIECARAAWDAGLFFEVHELLEPVWLDAQGDKKHALQGLIMAGASLHHLTHDNLAGARGLLREASRRLMSSDALPPYDLSSFGRGLRALAEQVEEGSVKGPEDVEVLPSLERSDDKAAREEHR